ncbi:pentapeptide repeat-containing protein [Thiomonas sp. FB-6]|uniref:DUF2169 family type VI secretion system accessory protein n=1 Tax=Thiomonas sp. FB-6 TaxID=1158291 RepID=UPI00036BAF48|nr:pentapeptide repeat-containing protein [Thiomonas sp. FB-6]
MHKSLQVRGEPRPDAATPVDLPELGPLQARLPADSRARDQARAHAAAWLSAWPHGAGTTGPVAPADQCLAEGLVGDESLEMLHLHPLHRLLRTRLPGLRPRCLWTLPPGPAGAGHPGPIELPLRACTLWLFPDRLRAILVFEARVATTAAHSVRDETLLARWVPCAEQGSFSMSPSPRQDAPAGLPSFAGAADATPKASDAKPPPRPEPAAQAREMRGQMAEAARQRLREQGWSQARLEQLDASGWTGDPPEAALPLEDLLKQLNEQTETLRRTHGIDDPTLQRFLSLAERELQDSARQGSAPQALARALQDLDAATHKALADAGLDAQRAQRMLRRYQPEAADALQAALAEAPPASGAAAGPRAAPPQDKAEPARGARASGPCTREQVREWLSEGRSLRGAKLDGLDLRGLDLSGADLREVQARGTLLAACTLRRADLREALLHDADLRRADLREARLGGCSCARARLDGAWLDQADCGDADFTQAGLAQASLRGACLRDCVFEQADLRAVSAERCKADGAQFGECTLDDGDWRGSSLRSAAWLDCSLSRLRAHHADARDLALQGSRAREVVFEHADLRGSRAGGSTRLVGARLEGADLRDACWEGSVLAAADLRACRLDGANFSRVRARGARMSGVHGSWLRLDEADLRGVDLRGAKLLQASLAGADLRGASLAGALCFGADLADTRGPASTWRGADLRRTVLAARSAASARPEGLCAEPAS